MSQKSGCSRYCDYYLRSCWPCNCRCCWRKLHLWPAVLIEKSQLKTTIGSAEEEAKKIIEEAVKTAEAKKKEAVLEGKDEIHQLRDESEKELAERRKEVQRQERRIQQREESLD